MRMMYLITRGDSIGGAQIHVRDLALHLADRGDDVHVAMGSPGPLSDQLERAGVPTHVVPPLVREASPLTDLRAVRAVRDLLTDVRPELVSTHSSKAGAIGRVAARLEGVPCLFTAHGWSFTDGVAPWQRTAYFVLEAGAALFGSEIICVSHHDEALVRHVPWMRARARTIQNGVHDVPPESMATPGVGDLRLVMIGRLDHQKDHASLFHALARVGGAQVDLIGDGPHRSELERLAAELRISDRVRFLGQLEDVTPHLAAATVFVLASRWEGLPRSILEAMRAGLPVVASDVGGVAELVEHGRTGHLVARGDTDGLVDALTRYSLDPERRAAHGTAGRARYEEHFTFSRLAEETERVYRRIISGG